MSCCKIRKLGKKLKWRRPGKVWAFLRPRVEIKVEEPSAIRQILKTEPVPLSFQTKHLESNNRTADYTPGVCCRPRIKCKLQTVDFLT